MGYLVIILGERDHPEVLALRSYAGEDSLVVENPRPTCPHELPSPRVGVVVQTTQSQERLADLAAHLAPRTRELLVHNTICSATEQRQAAAMAMADEVDAVVVVGGGTRATRRRLAELCAGVAAADLSRGVGGRARPRLVPGLEDRWASRRAPRRHPSRSKRWQTDWQDSTTMNARNSAAGWPSSATPMSANPPSSTASPAAGTRWWRPSPVSPGTARKGEAEWIGREFVVVDTGGIDLQSDEPLGGRGAPAGPARR